MASASTRSEAPSRQLTRQAVDGAEKVICAKTYLDAACPQLCVLAHSEEFDQSKRGLSPRRSERRYEFQHVFYGAPNPEMCSEPARREDCLVGCMNADWLAAYEAKYAA